MKVSISSNYIDIFNYETFKETVFSSIELHEDHISNDFKDEKFEISSIIPNSNFYNLINEKKFDKIKKKLDYFEIINSKRIIVDLDLLFKKDFSNNDIDSKIDQLSKLFNNYKLKLSFLLPSKINSNFNNILRKIISIKNPSFYLTINSKNILMDGSQPSLINQIPLSLIDHVQLTDISKYISSEDQISNLSELLPNEGVLDLKSFIKIFLKKNYKGSISVANNNILNNKANLIKDANRAFVSVFDDVVSSDISLDNLNLKIPPKINLNGFEFLEFTVFGEDHTSLVKMLKKLSFRKERIHKTKNVELWRQGSINILINFEKNSFAEQVYLKNGPSICDIAIKVKDAIQTIDRAKKLGIKEHSQSVSVGELKIPAIKGVDGSVIHFIDQKSNLFQLWNLDFNFLKPDPIQPSGLRSIDHISQSMKEEEMRSWLFFYLSNFNMYKTTQLDLVSSKGIIKSQAISSPEGEVRLNLNGSNNSQTIAGSFMTNKTGSSIQHIAFNTDDIFETVNILSENKFPFLQIDKKYYSQLQNKYDLDEKTLNNLKRNNILYDKNEFGEFFQIYSEPIFTGFFFEIVQRKQNYKGYGESNATHRIKSLQNYYDERKSA